MHRAMPLPVLGGVSQAEGMALGAFTTSGAKEGCTPTLDERMHGLFLGDGARSMLSLQQACALTVLTVLLRPRNSRQAQALKQCNWLCDTRG